MKNASRHLAFPALPVCIGAALLFAAACTRTEGAAPKTPPSTAAPAIVAGTAASSQEDPDEKEGKQYDPANARGGVQRYEGGLKMKSDYDVSKVNLAAAPVEHGDDDGHDHDHAQETPGSGEQYLPQNQAQRNKGRVSMLEDESQVHDFGKLRQGDLGNHDFLMVSDGEEPLVITGVKPSCGCTKAEVLLLPAEGEGEGQRYTIGDPIAPGTRFKLHGQINTDGRQGNFSAQISIYANDPRGTYNLRLTAEVEPVLTVDPSPTVFFGRMTTADSAEETVKVRSNRGEPFLLTSVTDTQAKPIELEVTPVNPDADGRASEWTVRVGLGANSEIGMRHYPINLRSDLVVANPKYPSPDDSPQYHGVMINVQAQVMGMVSAEPTFLTFGMVRPGEEIERSVRIECHDDFKLTEGLPVAFEGLQGQEFPFRDVFEVQVVPAEGGSAADVKVRLKGFPEGQNGSFGGVLKIQVGHPHMPELQLRFSGVCRPGLPSGN